jgi:hypothetical protein
VDDDAAVTAGGGVGDASVEGGGGADGLGEMEGWKFFFICCDMGCCWECGWDWLGCEWD